MRTYFAVDKRAKYRNAEADAALDATDRADLG